MIKINFVEYLKIIKINLKINIIEKDINVLQSDSEFRFAFKT